ncbi:MAG: ChaN family lipoprotein [Thermodesulfobacteriota bacterium]|nr:ChaN family lipoprotein [Thermodesulfobacteriota bacterium]
MKALVSLFAMASLLLHSLPGCSYDPGDGAMMRLKDGQQLTLSEIVEDLKGVQMVFVGELHTSGEHHEMQLAVIQALTRAGAPVAVGLEMFRRDSQKGLDQWVLGQLSEEDFEKVYKENWNYHWHLYRDIFVYARKHQLPMLGLNVSPDITRQVASHGFASLSPEQTGQLEGVTCQVDKAYMDFIGRAFSMHGHGGKDFVYFCEAQMVWDTAMALNLVAFLSSRPEFTVVVLAGSGHAWKHGIPAQVRKRADLSYRIILPEIEGRTEEGKVSYKDADYLWLTK